MTSEFDAIFMFPSQVFGEICLHNMHVILHALSLFFCVTALNTNYQLSKVRYQRKMHLTLWHSSS